MGTELEHEMNPRTPPAITNPLCDANVHCMCRFIRGVTVMRDGILASLERYECHRCGHQEMR